MKFKGLIVNYAYSTERIEMKDLFEKPVDHSKALSIYLFDEETKIMVKLK